MSEPETVESWKASAEKVNKQLKELNLIVETLIMTGKLNRKDFNKTKKALGAKPCRK